MYKKVTPKNEKSKYSNSNSKYSNAKMYMDITLQQQFAADGASEKLTPDES